MTAPRRASVLATIAVLLAGCAGETPSTSAPATGAGPSMPGLASPPASTVAPPTASSEPVLEPIPAPTVLPAGAPFDVSWTELTGRDAPSVNGSLIDPAGPQSISAVRWGAGAVVVQATSYVSDPGPFIWWSPDLSTWSRAVAPQAGASGVVEAYAVVVGGPGLVVLGANVNESGDIELPRLWTSTDGEHWQPGIPPTDARFIWARPGRIVAFGRSTWVSADGRSWTEQGPSPFSTIEFLEHARASIVDDGDGAIVLASTDFEAPTTVHRLGSDGSWTALGSIEGIVHGAVRGPTGIVALGSALGDAGVGAAWSSADGRTWETRTGIEVGGRLVSVAAGYVVVGARDYYQGGCDGFDPSQQIVNTWTSPDGLAWKQMPEDGALDHIDLSVVLPDGDRLIAFGLQWSPDTGGGLEDRSTPSVWASGPLVPPTNPGPKATFKGCR